MPKIANETDLQYKRRVIDIKSASFCAAKWYNATIWLGSVDKLLVVITPYHMLLM
jgi:hypothetical protein